MSGDVVQPRRGRLILVPTPLDFGCDTAPDLRDVLPEGSLRTAATLRHWVGENARSTRAFLKRLALTHPLPCTLPEMQITELPHQVHKHGDHQGGQPGTPDARALLQAALQGHDIGLVSEAGMPAIADPGSSVVRAAHALGLEVLPLVGPVSVLLALAASGLNGQNFAFVGYLPHTEPERSQRARALETLARQTGQAQLCIETPYRNGALLAALLGALQPQTRLMTASALTMAGAQCRSASVQEWQRQGWTLDNRTPTVFGWGVDVPMPDRAAHPPRLRSRAPTQSRAAGTAGRPARR